jgi:hypothetical protein
MMSTNKNKYEYVIMNKTEDECKHIDKRKKRREESWRGWLIEMM